jgi:protein involved in polysaccharide export with SLBB domain
MKNLIVPVFLGALGLTALIVVDRAEAQNGFNSSAMPNANPFRSAGIPPSQIAPPQGAPASGMNLPGGAAGYNSYNGYPGGGVPGFAGLMTAEPVDPNHKLGRGDRLSYRVVEDRDDKVMPLVVTDSGDVDVPLIGRVKAMGKSPSQLTADIKSQLEKEYYWPGHATVVMGLDLVAPRVSKGRVYVTGSVRTEGAVELPLDEPLTVSKAIARSGGFRDVANQRKVRLVRKGGPAKGIIVDVKAINAGDDKAEDPVLQPEDKVVVPDRGIIF